MRAEQEAEFVKFVEAASASLLTVAWLITAQPHRAEDLVQVALERVYLRWGRLRGGDPTAYARRCVLASAADRGRARPRAASDRVEAVVSDPGPHVDLASALQTLPIRDRECVVLRHYVDLSERETAQTLKVSLRTVQSSTSRGLASLRALLIEEGSHV